MKNPRRHIAGLYQLGFSLSGLGLLAILVLFNPASKVSFPWQKQLTISIFALICALGTYAGFSPSRCSRMLHFKETQARAAQSTKEDSSEQTKATFKGHHPSCGNFSSHVLTVGGRIYCAGCTGLVTGGVISLAGSFFYLFFDLDGGNTGVFAFWLGLMGVGCGLLQYYLSARRGDVHFLLNVAFVVGAFLLLVGVNELGKKLVLNLYLMALIVYWIATRIALSQAEHRRICSSCDLESCSLSFDS